MNITAVLTAAAVIALTGLVVGIGLGLFGEKFKVVIDEKQAAIRAELPGANCGGCGFAGCDACAEAISKGKAPADACPVGGAAVKKKIAAILGQAADEDEKPMVAFVRCAGTCDKSKKKYEYHGVENCLALSVVPGAGDKGCEFGCMGYGACVQVCKFDAIHLVNGIAQVDENKCTACQSCIKTCPQHIIGLVPKGQKYKIHCSSHKRGKEVKQLCEAGCIGCTLCVKQCENDAIHMDNNVPVIDFTKCTECGKCAEKCPQKVIAF